MKTKQWFDGLKRTHELRKNTRSGTKHAGYAYNGQIRINKNLLNIEDYLTILNGEEILFTLEKLV